MIVKSCANLNITCSYPFYVKCLSLSSSCLVCLKMGHFFEFFRQFDSPSTYNCVLPLDFYFLCNKTTRQKLYIFCVQNPRKRVYSSPNLYFNFAWRGESEYFPNSSYAYASYSFKHKKNHPRSEKFHIPLFALRNVARPPPKVTPLETWEAGFSRSHMSNLIVTSIATLQHKL